MFKGPLTLLLLLMLALAALFAVPALATANPVNPDHLGFCKKTEVGQVKSIHGKTYRCTHDGNVYEWEIYSAPTSTPTPTLTSTPPVATVGPTTPAPGALPVTGAKTDWMIGGGVASVAAGAIALLVGRRRRIRLEA
jgi:LPXTG-motif cell wall-anchored protein